MTAGWGYGVGLDLGCKVGDRYKIHPNTCSGGEPQPNLNIRENIFSMEVEVVSVVPVSRDYRLFIRFMDRLAKWNRIQKVKFQ